MSQHPAARYIFRTAPLLATLLAVACSTLPQLAGPIDQFAAATQAVAGAERQYLQQLRRSDETAQRSEATLAYVLDPQHPKLAPPVKPTLTTAQTAALQAVLDALQLYAEQLQRLAAGDNGEFDEASRALAQQALATDQAVIRSGIAPEQAGKAATALTAIADALTDRRRSEAIQATVARLDPAIGPLVDVLKGNNTAAAARIKGNRQQYLQSLGLLLQLAGSSGSSSSAELALFYRQIDSDTQLLDASGDSAAAVNAALDAWRDAHHAMASTPTAQWSALLPALRHRVDSALSFYRGLQ